MSNLYKHFLKARQKKAKALSESQKQESSRLAAKCFVPVGSSGAVIYAVVLRDHPTVVKIGRSFRWAKRRMTYDFWNLREGDGVLDERVFCVTDEYVDLHMLESAILDAMDAPIYRGREWFVSDIETAERTIDQVMCLNEVSYI